jgi:hypothetical protein
MKPNRSNYEIWLIDWLDGTLNLQQTDELRAFLDENPDIREEADSLKLARLSPSTESFAGKEKLQRSSAGLSELQIEYLSAAYLEGDLSPEQEADLRQNLNSVPENSIIFNKIRKTKLVPPVVHYMNKSKLKKITVASQITRISAIVLSAAAVIAFLILNHLFVPKPTEVNSEIASALTPDTIYAGQPVIIKNRNNIQAILLPEKSSLKSGTEIPSPLNSEQAALVVLPDSMTLIARIQGPGSIVFTGLSSINLDPDNNNPSLIASAINYSEPVFDDDRSRLSRFIARTFRDKILKEKQVNEEPLKSYEIAEAGIEGLNKLLGWQMALVKTNDEAGELKSVYFSSKMLKFNAPVKKSEELQ